MQGEILAGAGVGVRKKSGLTGAPAVKFLCGLIDIAGQVGKRNRRNIKYFLSCCNINDKINTHIGAAASWLLQGFKCRTPWVASA